MLMLLVGALAALATFLVVGTTLAPALALRRYRNRLRSLQVTALHREALRSVDAAGIRRRFPEAAIFNDQPAWTDVSLAKALDDLYATLAAEDRRTAERGPGSWVSSWYDSGLATIREVLDNRLAR